MELTLPDLRSGYVELLRYVLERGQRVTSRSLDVVEVLAARIVFDDPLAPLLPVGVGRGVNARLAAVEALQLIAGTFDAQLVRDAAPTFADVLVDPTAPDYGAYGPRLGYAIGDCLTKLRDDRGTRQAVALIWRPDDLEHDGDKPCTVFLQFLVRPNASGDDALDLYAYMRSQDVWLGVPYDVFMFSQLQHTLARELRLPAGRYVHHATSLHVYARDVERAWQVVDLATTRGALDRLDDLATFDVELPLGVVSVRPNVTGFEVAESLLSPVTVGSGAYFPRDDERAANAWYVAQLDQVATRRLARSERSS